MANMPPRRTIASLNASAANISAGSSRPTLRTGKIGDHRRGHFVGIYGSGGSGKTTLSTMLPGKTVFFDLEGSLEIISPTLAQLGVLDRITPVYCDDWNDLIAQLDADGYDGFDNVVIDSFTKAQELAAENCMQTIKGDAPMIKDSMEQWMYGKGAQLVFDKFRPIYAVIEKHMKAGRHVVATAHNEPTRFVNAEGSDYFQNQPRLVQGEKGKAPGRATFQEKTDHLLFLTFDIHAEKGKATGSGTRSLYTSGGDGTRMAKSRTTQNDTPRFDIDAGAVFDWSLIIH